jgi:hypothetical protein
MIEGSFVRFALGGQAVATGGNRAAIQQAARRCDQAFRENFLLSRFGITPSCIAITSQSWAGSTPAANFLFSFFSFRFFSLLSFWEGQ